MFDNGIPLLECFVLIWYYISNMQFFKFTIVLTPEPGEEDVYNVTVPALPEIATFGKSLEEARFMAQDAMELAVLSRLEDGEQVPQDKKPGKIAKNAKVEEVVITVSHQVTASTVKDVKTAIFKNT